MTGISFVISSSRLILISGLLSGFFMAPVTAASSTASSATALSAHINSAGIATGSGSIAYLQNNAPPYNQTKALPQVSKSVAFMPVYPTPTISVSASGLKSHIASNGLQIDSTSAEADVTINSATITLALNPPPPKNALMPMPQSFLTISVNKVNTASSFNQVFPSFITPTGSTSIGSLVLSGSLLNSSVPIEFKGNPSVNYVLFENQNVMVTLNRQMIAALVSCNMVPGGGGCQTIPSSISTAAIDIVLNNALIAGQSVSGEIIIGNTTAQ